MSEKDSFKLEKEVIQPLLSTSGPVPASLVPPPRGLQLGSAAIIAFWITLSGSVIIFNKYIFTTLNFPFPVFLTAYHMVVATIGTRLIRRLPLPGRFSKPATQISWHVWGRTIVPLAGLFSASLILSNVAYVHLSVSFVQMLKAFIPILTLIIQLIAGLQQYNHMLLAVIVITCLGCSIAAGGEIRFSMFGFLCQLGAVIVESARLVLIQFLLKEFAFDPLSSIAMYAPLCAVMIGMLVPIFEGAAPFMRLSELGFSILFMNGIVAFSLNVAGVLLIDAAGSLVLTLSGVVKDILLITCSVLFLGSSVSFNQTVGYSIALVGLTLFRLTGGSPNSPMGRQLVKAFQPVWQMSNTRFKGMATAVTFIVLATSFAFLTRSSPHVADFSVSEVYQRTIQYPLHGEVGRGWKESHTTFVQTGRGIDLIPPFDANVDQSRLGRIAWVVVATPNAIVDHAQTLNHIACYCARVGIPFYLEHAIMTPDRDFMTARHRSVAKYLRYYQWIFATDADTMIIDSRHDLRQFLDDSIDVIFNDRDQKELCACAFFVRNSPGGWSFLRRWMAWGDNGPRLNSDNGDLIEMIAAGHRPGLPNNADDTGRYADLAEFEELGGWDAVGCMNNATDWFRYADFVGCMDQTISHLRYRDDTIPFWDTVLWPWSTSLPSTKLRSYKTLAGYFRWSEGDIKHKHWLPWYDIGLPGDFIAGGKNFSVHLNEDSVLCSGKEWLLLPQNRSLEEYWKVLKPFNFTWWPPCFDERGVNRCLTIE